MSDKFYDFDKDDGFDEIYSKGTVKKPVQKEFEIEIPAPSAQSNLKSTMPQKNAKPVKKKMPASKKVLITVGIILTCIIAYLGSFLGVIFGWSYLPKSLFKGENNSKIKDVQKSEDLIEFTDDGTTAEFVPLYEDVPEYNEPSDSSSENDGGEDESGAENPDGESGGDSENPDGESGDDSENPDSGDSSGSGEEDIITID